MQEKFEDLLSSSCEVKSVSNSLIVTGYIRDAGEDFLEITSKKDKMLLEKANSKVKIIINSSKTGTLVLMGTVYLSTDSFMRIIDVQTLSDFEKRDFYRVNIQFETEAAKLTDVQSEELTDVALDIPIQIKDVSLGGLLFQSDNVFAMDDEFIVSFPVFMRNLFFAAKVCRIIETNGSMSYGCKFIDPSQTDLDCLYKYLLDMELSQIRSKLN